MASNTWPRIGVGAIVFRGTKILLVKRMYPPFQGLWSIPGGHLKPGETIYDAARRELLEETGIEAKPLGIADIHELIITSEDGSVERHYILIDVLLEYQGGEPRPASDALDARFIELREALEKLPLTPSSRKLLERIAANGAKVILRTTRTICRTEEACS